MTISLQTHTKTTFQLEYVFLTNYIQLIFYYYSLSVYHSQMVLSPTYTK
jgi:hypothetical protein